MITEDCVSFETAKLLKEKGFDEACWSWYHNGNHTITGTSRYCNNELYKHDYSKPTLQMAMKWLREVYGLFIDIYYEYYYDKKETSYMYSIKKVPKGYVFALSDCPYLTYEEAAENAIKYCLKKLL